MAEYIVLLIKDSYKDELENIFKRYRVEYQVLTGYAFPNYKFESDEKDNSPFFEELWDLCEKKYAIDIIQRYGAMRVDD